MTTSMAPLTFHIDTLHGGPRTLTLIPSELVIAGWTGRDRKALEHHIAELEALGVKRPASIPTFYPVSPQLLTMAPAIACLGQESSGEVEFVLVQAQNQLWVGLASDHTDRKFETISVSVSKQMCAKPIAPTLWPFDEVKDHWDDLVLTSEITENGTTTRYQHGGVSHMLAPDAVCERLEAMRGSGLQDGSVMLCGTLAAMGGIRPSSRFDFRLEDPVLKRVMRHSYQVESLAITG